MDYQNEFVIDFVSRTRKNLEFIEDEVKLDPDADLYEVTQLVNSLLGIIVLPRENYIDNIPKTELVELTAAGWPIVDKLIGELPENCITLQDLVVNMRHCIAHFNIKFIADSHTNELTGLKLWNRKGGKKGKLNWRTTITIEELRKATLLLLDVIENKLN